MRADSSASRRRFGQELRPGCLGGLSLEGERAGLIRRLRARELELAEVIQTRIREVDDRESGDDSQYRAGQCAAIAAAVRYGLTALERGEDSWPPIPSAIVEQTRRTARTGVSLDTVLLFYIVGHSVLGDFVMDEARRGGVLGYDSTLHDLRRLQDALLEHLAAVLAEEYKRERKRLERTAQQRRREEVQRLLAGKSGDPTTLDYEFEAWHLGVIATGIDGTKVLVGLARAAGREVLHVSYGEETVWAWLSGRRALTSGELERRVSPDAVGAVSLAVGEPRWGITGWRMTHREAQAALRIALRRSRAITRSADVLLDAAVLGDEVLTASLVETYLRPLDALRVGGPAARETLRAYFTSQWQVSSTASSLGVARKTVENRLRDIERALGRQLRTCGAELEVALRVEALDTTALRDSP